MLPSVIFTTTLFFILLICARSSFINFGTLSGEAASCAYPVKYNTSAAVSVPMCTATNKKERLNGDTIISLLETRGYLPTCRVMHLMLWMASAVKLGHARGFSHGTYFIDIGANIGSCSVHMASLGFSVVAVEPVPEHIRAINGSIALNPTFNINLHHAGISSAGDKSIQVNFEHGGRNWGASAFHEADANATPEISLQLRSVDDVIGSREVALMKIDCEGCEWMALKGAKTSLHRIPMIKLEFDFNHFYKDGNESIAGLDLAKHLLNNGYDLFVDIWPESDLYFGRMETILLEIDQAFGFPKLNINSIVTLLHFMAQKMLNEVFDPSKCSFSKRHGQRHDGKPFTDLIAIKKSLSFKMRNFFLIKS